MNKEINTIIANLEGCIGMFDYLLTPTESNLLVAYIEELQQENKKLKERIEYLERSNNRREDIILEQRQEINNLEDNWNKLKEWVNKHYDYYMNNEDYIGGRLCFTDIKNKMQEIEGNDSDE